jgi:hypothetical protein
MSTEKKSEKWKMDSGGEENGSVQSFAHRKVKRFNTEATENTEKT